MESREEVKNQNKDRTLRKFHFQKKKGDGPWERMIKIFQFFWSKVPGNFMTKINT